MLSSSNIFLVLLFLMVLNASCSNKKQAQKHISLEPVESMSELNDSTFIANVGTIKSANNRLYIALYLSDNLPQVLQLGPDLDLLRRIDKNGKGPGEFITVKDMSIVNDSLYLYDDRQAKILVYDLNNNFIREVRVPEASGFDMVVDNRSRIFLSTPNHMYPITRFNAEGQEAMTFGNNTIGRDSRHFLRNSRFLFTYNDRLIAIGRSEPVLEIYSLEGKFISKAKIAPPEIRDLIARVKKENEGKSIQPNVTYLSNLFYAAAMYKNSIYLMEAKHTNKNTNTYNAKFTYLFKYELEPNGDVTFKRTFKLFRSDRDKLMYGFQFTVVDDHKLVVYDMMGNSLLLYEDKRL